MKVYVCKSFREDSDEYVIVRVFRTEEKAREWCAGMPKWARDYEEFEAE